MFNAVVWLVRFAAFYNFSGGLVFLTPGALEIFGVAPPHSLLWVWLPALMGSFAGITLMISSTDLETYGSLPFWNGIIRLVFAIATFALDFPGTAGQFFLYLAIGDLFLAAACIGGLPHVLKRSYLQMMLNQRAEKTS